jgi:hypothetical protein
MKKTIPLILLTAVVAGGLGFWGGMAYQTSKATASRTAAAAQYAGRAGRTGATAAGGFVSGQVLSMDAQSITVQLRAGGSQVIFYTPTTTASKPTDVPVSSIAVGDNITVMGTANSDGSVTANSIQVRPAGMPGPGGAAAPQGGQPGAAGTNTNAPAAPATPPTTTQ